MIKGYLLVVLLIVCLVAAPLKANGEYASSSTAGSSQTVTDTAKRGITSKGKAPPSANQAKSNQTQTSRTDSRRQGVIPTFTSVGIILSDMDETHIYADDGRVFTRTNATRVIKNLQDSQKRSAHLIFQDGALYAVIIQ